MLEITVGLRFIIRSNLIANFLNMFHQVLLLLRCMNLCSLLIILLAAHLALLLLFLLGLQHLLICVLLWTLQMVVFRFFTTFLAKLGGPAWHAMQFLFLHFFLLNPWFKPWSLMLLLTSNSTRGALSFLFLLTWRARVVEASSSSKSYSNEEEDLLWGVEKL